MLKITRTANVDGVMFKLEGKLLGPWVDEARRACLEAGRGAHRTALDLSAVDFADAAGAQLLRDLLGDGATLAGCSHFISELLELEKP